VKVARVAGTVVSTIQSEILDGRKLLLCDVLDAAGQPDGSYLIGVDVVGAGVGETVLLLDEGTSARQIVGLPAGPLRTLVVGIVDELSDDGTWVDGSGPSEA
jgi:ethanolamine utilization protein EutN